MIVFVVIVNFFVNIKNVINRQLVNKMNKQRDTFGEEIIWAFYMGSCSTFEFQSWVNFSGPSLYSIDRLVGK